MNEQVILAATLLGSIVGGAVGARISEAPVWKGGLLAGIASIIQFVVGELANIDQPLVYSLIYLIAVGLVGGRWGMRMTARQLSLVVVGSFLFALLAGAGVVYLAKDPGDA